MKTTSKLLIFAIASLVLATTTNAQTPREQLNQMVQQLQSNPSDNGLRERIIKLALTIKPQPVAPAEAERFDGRGEYAFKNAKNEADYLATAQEFEKASNAAPWVASFYFNVATAYEKAQRPAEAKRSFELYLLASPYANDARDVRRRIAGLEFAIEKANLPEVRAEKFLEQLEGAIWAEKIATHPWGGDVLYQRRAYMVRNRQLVRSVTSWNSGQPDPGVLAGGVVDSVLLTGNRLTYSSRDVHPSCNPVNIEISEDGQRITQRTSCFGLSQVAEYTRVQR